MLVYIYVLFFCRKSLFLVPSLSDGVSITPLNGPFIAGRSYNFTCIANVTQRETLNITTHIMWIYRSNNVISGTDNSLNFTIKSLQVSDAGKYTCIVNVSSSLVTRFQNFSISITINITGI